MSDLKPCPCVEIPKVLDIFEVDSSKWGRVSGGCCGQVTVVVLRRDP